ncbi:MAG: tRNA uridine(34) 5-carboxymethylaminomethyl modification radical SAM/GNAT enzyme Elp3 [Euryarchaeota archaeon]|nr:tRNA uridine(34) 5-carboxymethylaminomethyl modification radical SAM/GNAT enzyme Elp3 [Euryarchaeota archaeon]
MSTQGGQVEAGSPGKTTKAGKGATDRSPLPCHHDPFGPASLKWDGPASAPVANTPAARPDTPPIKPRRPGLHVPRPVLEGPRQVHLPPAVVVEVLDALDSGLLVDKESLHRFKIRLARQHRLSKVPSDADLLAALPEDARLRHRDLLRKKATRTLSGVAIVTIQSSPESCPHGTCVFCPGGPDVGSAQSYTGEEPAALRARAHAFDPYAQTASRLDALKATGHDIDKVDLIIQGGTFTARDLDYQEWFVKRAMDAMNDAALGWDPTIGARPGPLTLDETKQRNETAPARCIGLTVETKPDWWKEEHIDIALNYGATRVELGIQTVDDEILRRTNRGHDTQESKDSTRRAKDAGFKVCHHLMPGLPGSDPEKDVASGHALFSDPEYRPDMLKVYPTLVMPGTPLAVMHDAGRYQALGTDEAARVIARIKMALPPYVRVQRVDRDIPTTLIQGGVDKSNVRQLAHKVLEEMGEHCRCVRCREVGHLRRDAGPHHAMVKDAYQAGRLVLRDLRYEASGGEERFLSVEDEADDAIFGYLRLRRLHAPHRPELRPGDAMVREVKVPGQVVPVGTEAGRAQHRGLGTRLCIEAARITHEEWGTERLFVIAGIGVKPYYRRLGFTDDGVYLRATTDGSPHHGLTPLGPLPDVPYEGTTDL